MSRIAVRWRLTFFYAALLLVMMLILGGVLYAEVAQTLTTDTQQSLEQTAISYLRRDLVPGGLYYGNLGPLAQDLAANATHEVRGFVIENNGTQLYSGVTLRPNLGAAFYRQALATGDSYELTATLHRTPFMVFVMPIPGAFGSLGLIQMVGSMAREARVLFLLRLFLLLDVLVALPLGLLAGLPVVGIALRPLRRLVQTTQAIAEGDLTQRAELPHTHDEIGNLGVSFNQMLDRIQQAFFDKERSEARTRRFAADASHELRSPLTIMAGYLDALLLGAKSDPEKTDRALRSARREVERMRRLTDDLLTLTRFDGGAGQTLVLAELEVAPLMRDLAERARFVAEDRSIDVQVQEGLRVQGDRDQLERAIWNLIENALRYSPKELPVTIGAASDGALVRIFVRDQGPGLSAEEQAKLFERFYRADPSRSRKDSFGLGLAIVKAIIEAHGGRVFVESALGQGSTFGFYLPAVC